MSHIEAMKQALEALLHSASPRSEQVMAQLKRQQLSAITALRQAIAEAEKQEPVAWFESDGKGNIEWHHDSAASDDPSWLDNPMPVYTHPQPKREWVGLTDDDLDYLCHLAYTGDEEFAYAVEAKLKQNNGYSEENT